MGPHRISNNNGRLMSAAYIVYYSSDLCGSRLYSMSGRLGTTFSQHPHLAQTYILPTTSSPCNSSCTWIPSDNFETSLSKSISFHIKLCHWFFLWRHTSGVCLSPGSQGKRLFCWIYELQILFMHSLFSFIYFTCDIKYFIWCFLKLLYTWPLK